MSDWGILVALAPFVVLGLLVFLSLRRSGNDRQEMMRFGRQSVDANDELARLLKDNNALLRQISERLERLERRS